MDWRMTLSIGIRWIMYYTVMDRGIRKKNAFSLVTSRVCPVSERINSRHVTSSRASTSAAASLNTLSQLLELRKTIDYINAIAGHLIRDLLRVLNEPTVVYDCLSDYGRTNFDEMPT